jgi:hypothetical protein
MDYEFGVYGLVKGGNKFPVKTNSIKETIDAIQECMEGSGEFAVEVVWSRDRYFENVHYQMNITRSIRIYNQVIDSIIKLRSFEIDFTYDNEYYDENIELTEIPMESSIFHYHNWI